MSGPNPAAKLNVVIRPKSGGQFDTWVVATPRKDGRYEGALEFRSADGRHTPFVTAPQTTQSTVDDVFRWGTGLSVSHIEDAFVTAAVPVERAPGGPGPAPTPTTPEERLRHLQPIERDVLHLFKTLGVTRIPAREFFARGPHANADFVRAFEDLEKRRRLLVRHTEQGSDVLELTLEGAHLLGLPAEPGPKLVREAGKPRN